MKWTTTAGPRQTKAISEAISKLNWEGKSEIERNGIMGVTEGFEREHDSVIVALCSDVRPEVVALREAIGNKYAWTITKENHALIAADFLAAIETAKASRPIRDNRRTPEKVAADNQRYAENKAILEERAAKKAEAVAAKVAELRALYPWEKQDGSNHARAAFNIKKELSLKFPGVDFSVKSKSFSMGDDVNVDWTDGPTTEEVTRISGKYQSGSFDGMTDCYNYDDSVEHAAVSIVLGCSKYVMENRHTTQAAPVLG